MEFIVALVMVVYLALVCLCSFIGAKLALEDNIALTPERKSPVPRARKAKYKPTVITEQDEFEKENAN